MKKITLDTYLALNSYKENVKFVAKKKCSLTELKTVEDWKKEFIKLKLIDIPTNNVKILKTTEVKSDIAGTGEAIQIGNKDADGNIIAPIIKKD